MGLSSNILWHQTDEKGFYEILTTKKLRYSYSLERIILDTKSKFKLKSFAFPMISTSDYPLSEIGNNKWAYGDYCIGFDLNWGEKIGFSPVCYCSYGSHILQQANGLLNMAIKNNSQDLIVWAMYMFSQMKFVEAPLKTKQKMFENYRFYDEREWRVVPNLTENNKAQVTPYLTEDGYNDYKEKNGGKSLLEIGEEFQYGDIRYIIVKTKEDINKTKEIVGNEIHIFTKEEIIEDVVGVDHHEEILPSQLQLDIEASLRHLGRVFNSLRERKRND